MNDSEAACFGAEALEYHCSVCDFVRLAVRPVNSDFDICIRLLFYLKNKWRRRTQGNSRDLDMVLLTRKQLPVVLKLDLYSSFWGVPAQTTVTRPTVRASFEVNLCPILKTSTPLQSPFHKLNDNGLLARIQREMTPWRSFEISRHFAAHHAERNDSDYAYLRASFEVI